MNDQLMDNNQYNLIMALGSNLEAYNAYQKYAKDGNQQLWNQLAQLTRQAVQLLQQEVNRSFSSGQSQSMQSGQTGSMGQSNFNTSSTSGSSSQPSYQGSQSGGGYASSGSQQSGMGSSQRGSGYATGSNQNDELTMRNPDQKSGYANENYAPFKDPNS